MGTRPAPTFITDTFDVTAYAGQDFILRWAYSPDAGWRPNPDDRCNTVAENRDIFTDCDDPDYANDPRHIDNYGDPDTSDGNWHFGYSGAEPGGLGHQALGPATSMTAECRQTWFFSRFAQRSA